MTWARRRRRTPPLFAAATGIAALGQYSIVASPLVLLLERTRLKERVAPPTALGSDDVRLILGRGGGDGSHLHRWRSHCGFGRRHDLFNCELVPSRNRERSGSQPFHTELHIHIYTYARATTEALSA